MSRSSAPGDSGANVNVARIVAVGLLLLAVVAAAGCESVKARARHDGPSLPVLGQDRNVPEEADGEAPEDTSPEPADDTTPAFAPVPPHAPLPAFNRAEYLGRPVDFVANDKHEVALTFDDGPSKNTLTILRVLGEHDAHATFFFVGKRAEFNDNAVISVVAQGSEIADHTWSHRSLRHLDATMTATQVDHSQAMLAAESGSEPAFVRPRGGKYDEGGRMALADRGLILALWSIHANDIDPSPAPDVLVKNVVHPAKAGSIILMHETNPNTALALPKILAGLRAKGLHPVTLSQLLADGHP